MHRLFLSFMLLSFAVPVSAEQGKLKINVFPLPPILSASVRFSEPSGNDILDAGETGKLILILANSGKGDAFEVKAELTADKAHPGLTIARETAIGTVPAGKTVTREIELRAAGDIPSNKITFTVEIREANGFAPPPLKIYFKSGKVVSE